MSKIIHIILTLIMVTGTACLLGFADREHGDVMCHSMSYHIINPGNQMMIHEDEIDTMVTVHFGNFSGETLRDIDLNAIEGFLLDNPYISEAQVYGTLNGYLSCECRVRYPVVRVVNNSDQQFFIDEEGVTIPVNTRHPVRLLIINGKVNKTFKGMKISEQALDSTGSDSLLYKVYQTARYINRDEFLSSLINQIYVDERGELEMVPELGQQLILFGRPENITEKFEKLIAIYKQEMSTDRWKRYKTINLKFENQVVCTK